MDDQEMRETKGSLDILAKLIEINEVVTNTKKILEDAINNSDKRNETLKMLNLERKLPPGYSVDDYPVSRTVGYVLRKDGKFLLAFDTKQAAIECAIALAEITT